MTSTHRGRLANASWADGLTLLGLVLLALGPVLPDIVLTVAGIVLLAASLRPMPRDGRFSRPARAMVGALCLYFAAGRVIFVWPAYLLVPILVVVLLGALAGFGREVSATLARGRLGRTEWLLVAVIALAAGAALVGWTVLLRPDLSKLQAMVPRWPLPALVGAGVVFSVGNAVLEEVIWRGVLQRWLATFMAPAAAVAVQAASFGALHYGGFPNGWVGVGLATLYGLMIGGLALRSGGLLAPVLAHIAADAVIFILLASSLD
jgi:hypothetical protein